MENVQLDIESAIAELTVKAFNTFVEDITAMFDTTVTAKQADISTGTVKDLKDQYQQLSAVCSVAAEGPVNGKFYFVFDRNGIFTLPGTFTMQSEKVILENINKGDEAAASEVAETLGDIGNLMVGAWDKVFKEELEQHKHFIQTGTYIGDPWTDPEEKIHLDKEGELSINTFEIVVDPLPAFKCSVIYPKSIFKFPAEDDAPAEETAVDDASAEESASDDAQEEEATVDDASTEECASDDDPAEESAMDGAQEEEPAPAEDAPQQAELQQGEGQKPALESEKPVSETINNMTSSPAVLPGDIVDQSKILVNLTAADVMRKDLVWADAENTVEELIAKMQQHDTAYLMIGDKNKLEGIISKSDIRGALSPYLQSMFAKWRDSMDTATLQIKAKWVMSRPVRTVTPDATLKLVIQTMSEHGGRCMPVVDQQGKVQGIVTVFDIFYALLNCGSGAGSAGRTIEAPPLV